MAFTFVYKGSEASLSAGEYPGWLVDIEPFESQYGGALKWHFVALSEDREEIRLTTVTSTVFSSQSKAAAFAGAILQRTFQIGEQLKSAQLYSKRCRLVVSVKTLDNERVVNRIDDVKSAPNGEPTNDDDVPF